MNTLSKNMLLFSIVPAIAALLVVSAVTVTEARVVCGDRLCSEVGPDYLTGYFDDSDDDRMEGKHMDDDRMEGKYMDDDRMEGKHMDDDRMEGKHMGDDRMDAMDGDRMEGKHMDDDHMEGKHMGDDRMDAMDGDHMSKDHMDKDHMDKDRMDAMDGDHMDRDHMDKYAKKLHLSRANVPATIPLHHGYYDGQTVYFIITDSSDPTHASIITESQGWKVEVAPPLVHAPDSALSQTYMFTNGMEGDGVHGFQSEVFTSTPATPDTYSALTKHTHVAWNDGSTPRLLTSAADVMAASTAGDVTLTDLDVVINMPHIMWPGGQMQINEGEINDKLSYGGGQVTEIDTEEMTVTFIAHRGWGPDGRSIYYIVTDAIPAGAAELMGVVHTPVTSDLLANAASVDLFQFTNGLKGSGPLGFQPGIATAALGDEGYSPMWRISVVTWEDPKEASLLLTIDDINVMRSEGKVSTQLARPADSDHIVNCPFIDPFQ